MEKRPSPCARFGCRPATFLATLCPRLRPPRTSDPLNSRQVSTFRRRNPLYRNGLRYRPGVWGSGGHGVYSHHLRLHIQRTSRRSPRVLCRPECVVDRPIQWRIARAYKIGGACTTGHIDGENDLRCINTGRVGRSEFIVPALRRYAWRRRWRARRSLMLDRPCLVLCQRTHC